MDDFFDFEHVDGITRNVAVFLVFVFWAATVYWVFKDARRRIEDPWLVGARRRCSVRSRSSARSSTCSSAHRITSRRCASGASKMIAIEEQLADRDRCPVCRGAVDPSSSARCARRAKQACEACGAPLEPIWQVCPYCAPGAARGRHGRGGRPAAPSPPVRRSD